MSGMEMEFSWNACRWLPASTRLVYLLSVVYAIWIVVSLRRVTRRQSGALALLLLPPLLLTTTDAWIGYARATQGLRLYGGGRGAFAAGIGEPLLVLWFGGLLTAGCAAIALLAVTRASYDAIGSYPRPPIVVAALCWATSLVALVMPSLIFPTGGGFAMWNISLATAFLSLALLIPLAVVAVIANRIVVPRRAQLIALATTLALALIQIAVAWQLIGHYRLIAMGR